MSSYTLPRSATLARIPSLDGLRAVSILLVIGLHSLQAYSAFHPLSRAWFALFNGGFGVFIFFEISGFLITTLLLEEHRKRGSISLSGFYVRRCFRIFPPLYLYIGVITALGLAGRLLVRWGDVLSSAMFFHDVYGQGTWWLEHLWSISVEEQFYLVWPFLLVLCLRWPGRQGLYAACVFPLAVIVVSPVLRLLLLQSPEAEVHRVGVVSLRFDFIMFGCLVALLQHTPRFEAMYREVTRVAWLPPAVIMGSSVLSAYVGNRFDLSVGYTISGFAIAMFLLWCTRNAESVVGWVLNCRPMVKIGVLSYSIYLWQTLFMHLGNGRAFAWWPWIGRYPENYLGLAVAACASYYLIEQPSLRLRTCAIRWLQVYQTKQSGFGAS